MRLLGYYVTHTFINSIKKLFRSWVVVFIVAMLLFWFLIGLGAGTLVKVLDKTDQTEKVVVEEEVDEEGENVFEVLNNMTQKEREVVYRWIACAVCGIVLIMLLYNIYISGRSGTEIFMMADVNFLFPAPLKPQTILMFKTILQMGLVVVGSLYMLFQIPNLVLNLGLGMDLVVLLLIMWILALLAAKLCSVFVYTLTATHESLRKYVRPLVILIALGLVFLTVTVARAQYDEMILDAIFAMYGSKIAWSIPFIGWMAGLVYAYLIKDFVTVCIYSVLMVVGFVVCILGIWHMKADFYEDALVKASITQQKMEAAKTGIQKERKRKRKLNRENEIGRGSGASAFFFKEMHNRKRFAWLSVATNSMLFYLGVALVLSIPKRYDSTFPGMIFFGSCMLLIIFFKSYVGILQKECEMNFIYLIPESAHKKISYLMLAEAAELLMDILPAFLLMGIVYRPTVLDVLMWMLLLLSSAFILSATTLFVHHILPTSLPETIYVMFVMFLKFMGVFPMVVIVLVMAFMDLMTFAFAAMFAGNMLVGALLVWISVWLMQKGRK